jgi:Urocanase Rossmann-like domain
MIDKTRYSAESGFALRVLSFYTRLIPPDSEPQVEPGLGGKLLYAGEMDDDSRALIAAANIAGAASLCATANAREQKQAVRDGIVDFLVTSLDEALRILKNEIRSRAPVAVCIGAPPPEIERQMAERGVLPDLLRSAAEAADNRPAPADVALVSWSVSSSPARWMPKLDAFALQCAGELPQGTRRWLRLSPRYLGRLAQSIHIVLADRAFATRFMEEMPAWEDAGIPLKLQISYRGGCEEFNLPDWDKDQPIVPSP